jgi:hypothetical protein
LGSPEWLLWVYSVEKLGSSAHAKNLRRFGTFFARSAEGVPLERTGFAWIA